MSKDTRIGALWKPKPGASDLAPLGKGNIDIRGVKIPIIVWVNRWKQEGENTPDYYIELDDRDPAPRAAARPAVKPPQARPAQQPRPYSGDWDEAPF